MLFNPLSKVSKNFFSKITSRDLLRLREDDNKEEGNERERKKYIPQKYEPHTFIALHLA